MPDRLEKARQPCSSDARDFNSSLYALESHLNLISGFRFLFFIAMIPMIAFYLLGIFIWISGSVADLGSQKSWEIKIKMWLPKYQNYFPK